MKLPKLNKDNHFVDEENKVVYWRGSYPFVMAIPGLTERHYPGYDFKIVTADYLTELKGI